MPNPIDKNTGQPYLEGDVPSSGNEWFGTNVDPNATPTVGTTDPSGEPTPTSDTQNQYTPQPLVQQPSTVPSEEYLSGQVENPTIPGAAIQQPVKQEEQAGETIDPGTGQMGTVEAPTVMGGQVDPVAQQAAIKAAEIVADQSVAQQGIVPPEATVRGQMESLMGDVARGDAPWADEAMRKATAIMLERGLGQSSMAADAIVTAVLESALPIAQYDAGVYGEMNLQNLRNRQETMLSNTAASNAAKQLNAQSVNEVNKYMAGLRDSVMKFNSTQKTAMDQFNAGQLNSMEQFHTILEDAAMKFNAENTLAIAKSNAEWRRTINTVNTAAINASNMINAQNAFNISQQAQADLWQRSRDVFNWANESAENDRDKAFQLTMYTLQREDYIKDMDQAEKDSINEGIGGFVFDIFSQYLTTLGDE